MTGGQGRGGEERRGEERRGDEAWHACAAAAASREGTEQ